MALAITAVDDIKFLLGQSGRLQMYKFQPGAADYVTGGYPVAAGAVELGLIQGAWAVGTNAAGALYDAMWVPASIARFVCGKGEARCP